ncbi:ATP-binding protein [Roseateles amylovorans]|uniref:Histidine kinase n=1 Tax=Roseateles amylovorans TaxID=2978473 RepID=A0ABY6BAN1_9BURK|nr:ATP-binding protein [Roseateles amylovorans]UXH80978.1 histidine kinase [Roseateles amylovorans]
MLATGGEAHAHSIHDFEHTGWTNKNGVVGSMIWVDDTPSGLMLLRTSAGYQVFDGTEFHSFSDDAPPPFQDVVQVVGQRAPTGAIYFQDPITRKILRSDGGRVEAVDDKDRAAAMTTRFQFDPRGIGWMGALNQLYRLEGLTVRAVNEEVGLPPNHTLAPLVVSREGALYLTVKQGDVGRLHYLLPGTARFQAMETPLNCYPLVLTPDGNALCASGSGLMRILMERGRPVGVQVLSNRSHGAMTVDRRGRAWMSSRGQLYFAQDWRELLRPGRIDQLIAKGFTVKDGLTSDGIGAIREDNLGQVWIATAAGLDRFRETRLRPVKLPRRKFGFAMLPDPEGGLWAANWDGLVMHLRDGKVEDVPSPTSVTALYAGRDGTVWVASELGLWKRPPGKSFVAVPNPPNFDLHYVRSLAEDDLGALWVQTGRRVVRWKAGQWSEPEGPVVPPPGTFYSIVSDARGRLWFQGRGPDTYVLENNRFKKLPSDANRAKVQVSTVLYSAGDRVWVGHRHGIGAYIGERFVPLRLKAGPVKDITGIVQTSNGDLWFHGRSEAYHVLADQVIAGLEGQPAEVEILSFHDGLTGATNDTEPRPTLVQDSQGLLWFSTTEGLFWLDPTASRETSPAPPAVILRSVQADGMIQAMRDMVSIPPLSGRVEVNYTAAALGVADRIQFRYRLQGVDKDWQQVGTRRSADYTQLAPGLHRFEVAATNERGVWSSAPSVLLIDVQPAWFQTAWFRGTAGFMLLVGLWVAYRLRVRVIARRERVRMGDIAKERERIARDLHDTLLQSMQGVILGFHGLATTLRPDDPVRTSIEGELERADELLGEARDRVRDLRTTGHDAVTLPEALALAATQLKVSARVRVTQDGQPRALEPSARDDLYLIAREALLNAALHANASEIELILRYRWRHMTLTVRDDGAGIPEDVLRRGKREGHFGVIGMRERAERLGGKLSLERLSRGGTRVMVQIPASTIYRSAPGDRRRRFRAAISLRVFLGSGSKPSQL